MLSQAEIDALLSGAIDIEGKDGNGRVNLAEIMGQAAAPAPKDAGSGKKISSYNFWSPDRFSKEQMRALELVHEDLAERLTTSMPTFLRTNLRPRLVHAEQGRFHDFLKDFPTNCLYHMLNYAPLPGQVVLTISPNVTTIILEQRLGGRVEGDGKERPLTDIDQSLLRGLVEHMLNDIKNSWARLVSIEPELEDSTTNQHWVQMLMGNERVMLLTFEVSLQNATGTMSIFLPFSTLKPIAGVLNPHVWITGRKEKLIDPVARKNAMETLASVDLPVCVYLGTASLTLGEILNLQIGDVVQLNTPVASSLTMKIAGQNLFSTQIGRVGNHLGAKIISVVREQPSQPIP
jgi:flagellar motor switch protein FliM